MCIFQHNLFVKDWVLHIVVFIKKVFFDGGGNSEVSFHTQCVQELGRSPNVLLILKYDSALKISESDFFFIFPYDAY